jgi:GNAT superfamily N-acetyltransferase
VEEIKIEKLESNKIELLREVALKSYSDHYLHLWHDEGKWYKDTFFSHEKLTEEFKDANAQFFVAFYNDEPVGFLKLNIDANLKGFEDRRGLELERIYLTKEAEGKGIGRKLVEETFAIAKLHNKNLVWLKAMDTSEGAINFYKKMGFAITGTHKLKHHLMKEELRGMVIMSKEL